MSKSVKMLLSLLVAAALCAPAYAAIETVQAPVSGTPTSPINPGWNLMSLPAIPTNPAPADVLDEYPTALESRDLYRWDAANQGLISYDPWATEGFGNLLLTEGYWLRLGSEGSNQLSFEGITDNDDTDMWVSLPKTGWTIIGCPFSYEVNWNQVEITDGTVTVPLLTARDQMWLDTVCLWWDSYAGGLCSMGLDDDWQDTSVLVPWHGYWIQSYRDNLALIVPAAS